jgi:hypothetical protein
LLTVVFPSLLKGMRIMRIADDHAAASVSPSSPLAADKYCPECGRLFSEPVLGRTEQVARRSWSSWILFGLGASLLVLFGPRAVVSVWAMANDQDLSIQRRALAAAEGPSVLATMVRMEQARTPLELLTADRSLGERDRVAIGLGGVLILLGLSARARQQLTRPARQTIRDESETAAPASISPTARTVLGVWQLGETFVVAACRVLFLVAGYFGITAFVRGEPVSWELIDQVTNRTLGLVSVIIQLTRPV